MSEKSLVILTNFWDANFLIDNRFILYNSNKEKTVYKVNLGQDKQTNFSVHSVALRPPKKIPEHLNKMDRLDFFCPTYDMLNKYKKDNDWESYKKDYIVLLKERQKNIREWFASLKPDWVYFLCCWENTATGAHCHRELIYNAFCQSKKAKDKIIPIYRHGEKIYKKETNRPPWAY